MPDPTPQQQGTQTFDPLAEYRKAYPDDARPDNEIIGKLQDPENFKKAFPDFDYSSPDTTARIHDYMSKYSLPNYSNGQQAKVGDIQTKKGAPVTNVNDGPSATNRFVTSAIGLPEGTQFSMKENLDELKHPVQLAKTVGRNTVSDLDMLGSHMNATQVAKDRFNKPGVMNKINGAAEWIESGVPFYGPSMVKAGEQFQNQDWAGGFGTMSPIAASMAVPVIRGEEPGFNPVTQEDINRTSTVPSEVNAARDATMRAANYKGKSIPDFKAVVTATLPELREQMGDDFKPTKGGEVRDIADLAGNAQKRIWDTKVQAAVDSVNKRFPGATMDGKPIAAAIRDSVSDLTPEQSKKALAYAQEWDGDINMAEVPDKLKRLNATLQSLQGASPEDVNAAGDKNQMVGAMTAARRALRGGYFNRMAELGEPDVGNARKTYGQLQDFEDVFRGKINAADMADLNKPSIAKAILKAATGPVVGAGVGAIFGGPEGAGAGGIAGALAANHLFGPGTYTDAFKDTPHELAGTALGKIGKTNLFSQPRVEPAAPAIKGMLPAGKPAPIQLPASDLGMSEWRTGAPTSGVINTEAPVPKSGRGLPNPSMIAVPREGFTPEKEPSMMKAPHQVGDQLLSEAAPKAGDTRRINGVDMAWDGKKWVPEIKAMGTIGTKK